MKMTMIVKSRRQQQGKTCGDIQYAVRYTAISTNTGIFKIIIICKEYKGKCALTSAGNHTLHVEIKFNILIVDFNSWTIGPPAGIGTKL